MDLIILAGLPATGKTTLAKALSQALSLPVLEKDEIKEALFDTLGYADGEARQRLGLAANRILLRCAESLLSTGNSLILVNNFDTESVPQVEEMMARVGCRHVTIFLTGDPELLHRRYVERDRKGLRHPAHALCRRYPPCPEDGPPPEMTEDFFRRHFVDAGMGNFRLNGPRIEVNVTAQKADTAALVREIQRLLAGKTS
ncbi:MAG: AAA family ATPase [Clostridia bacterium]|nr:AAA family ATPase [Clostridia bacterium]